MQCNIDARGKAVRLMWGMLCVLLAAATVVLIRLGTIGGTWAWIAAGGLLASGLFAIFEARKGWCGMRAMGCKTPV